MCLCGGVPPGGGVFRKGGLPDKTVPGDVISMIFGMRSVIFLRPGVYLLRYPHLPKRHRSTADPTP